MALRVASATQKPQASSLKYGTQILTVRTHDTNVKCGTASLRHGAYVNLSDPLSKPNVLAARQAASDKLNILSTLLSGPHVQCCTAYKHIAGQPCYY